MGVQPQFQNIRLLNSTTGERIFQHNCQTSTRIQCNWLNACHFHFPMKAPRRLRRKYAREKRNQVQIPSVQVFAVSLQHNPWSPSTNHKIQRSQKCTFLCLPAPIILACKMRKGEDKVEWVGWFIRPCLRWKRPSGLRQRLK